MTNNYPLIQSIEFARNMSKMNKDNPLEFSDKHRNRWITKNVYRVFWIIKSVSNNRTYKMLARIKKCT